MVLGFSSLRRRCGRRRWCSIICSFLTAVLLIVLAIAILGFIFRKKIFDFVACADEDSHQLIREYVS